MHVDTKTIARDLCAGTLIQLDLDKLDIFYLAEDRSDATDLTLGSGGNFEVVRFRLNGEEVPFTGDPTMISYDVNR